MDDDEVHACVLAWVVWCVSVSVIYSLLFLLPLSVRGVGRWLARPALSYHCALLHNTVRLEGLARRDWKCFNTCVGEWVPNPMTVRGMVRIGLLLLWLRTRAHLPPPPHPLPSVPYQHRSHRFASTSRSNDQLTFPTCRYLHRGCGCMLNTAQRRRHHRYQRLDVTDCLGLSLHVPAFFCALFPLSAQTVSVPMHQPHHTLCNLFRHNCAHAACWHDGAMAHPQMLCHHLQSLFSLNHACMFTCLWPYLAYACFFVRSHI